MLRAKLWATETTNIEAKIGALRKRCEHAQLPSSEIQSIEEQCRNVLVCLASQGREVGEMGSQMHVRREIAGEGYTVEVRFQAGSKRSMLQRLADFLLGVI